MNWIQYLWDKLPELKNLGNKDLQLSKLVARIHRLRSEVVSIQVPLGKLYPIHAIDRDTAQQRVDERARALKKVKNEWQGKTIITNDLMMEVIPSVSAIKVILITSGKYIAFEGNGRLYALKDVFEDLTIEVDLYQLENDNTISRRVQRVLELNGLESQ